MKTPIRILYLIDKLVPAGTQTNLLEIVKRLDPEKVRPYVIALAGGGELVDEFRKAGIEPVVLNVKKAYGWSGLKALWHLVGFIKREGIEIVQTHFLQADLLGTAASKLAGVKKLVTTRRDEGFWQSPRQRRLNGFLSRFADVVLVNSDAVRRAAMKNEGIPAAKIRVIYNGVDIRKFAPEAEPCAN